MSIVIRTSCFESAEILLSEIRNFMKYFKDNPEDPKDFLKFEHICFDKKHRGFGVLTKENFKINSLPEPPNEWELLILKCFNYDHGVRLLEYMKKHLDQCIQTENPNIENLDNYEPFIITHPQQIYRSYGCILKERKLDPEKLPEDVFSYESLLSD